MLSPLYRENFNVAVKSVRSNRLRSSLTIAIIAIGITSLVGILTATEALKSSLNDTFGKLGANSFYLSAKYSQTTNSEKRRVKNKRNISYTQAVMFVENYHVPSIVTIYSAVNYTSTLKYGSRKTEPNVRLVATDQNYLEFNAGELAIGRGLSKRDVDNASFVCVIGDRISKTLFRDINKDPIGEIISVGAVRYEVIGVAKAVGQSYGASLDNTVLIPVSNARSFYVNENSYFVIGIVANDGVNQEHAVDEAQKVFRSVRRLSPYDESDFTLRRNDSMLEEMNKTMRIVTIAAIIIGLITILGAAVGLMNIMLVSVKERTREIGTRKALGATSKLIKQQFLIESILIGQLGGLCGVIIGVIVGNVTARLMHAPFVVPWLWILVAVLLCLAVSMISGFMPAKRAAALDPIESLRYE